MFSGKVTARDHGQELKPGFALGTEIFIAAGTRDVEALAAKMAKMNRFATSSVTSELSNATTQPFTSGMTKPNQRPGTSRTKRMLEFPPAGNAHVEAGKWPGTL